MKKIGLLAAALLAIVTGCGLNAQVIALQETDLIPNEAVMVTSTVQYESIDDETIFKTLYVGENQDGLPNQLTLFYDGDVKLLFNGKEILIDRDVPVEDMYFDNTVFPYVQSYDMMYYPEDSLLAVYKQHLSMRGINTSIQLFTTAYGDLMPVWDSEELQPRMTALSPDVGTVTVTFAAQNEFVTLLLNDQEANDCKQRIRELNRNQVRVDDAYMKQIADNLIMEQTDVLLLDHDHDEKLELLILADFYTVGAGTPVDIAERAVLLVDLEETAQLEQVLFQRNSASKLLLAYFEDK